MALSIKVVTFNRKEEIDIGDVQGVEYTITNRDKKPYPPGNLRNTLQAGGTMFAWSHRNAFLQGKIPVLQNEENADWTPRGSYTLIIQRNGVPVRSVPNLTDNSFLYTTAMAVEDGVVAGNTINATLQAFYEGYSSVVRTLPSVTWV